MDLPSITIPKIQHVNSSKNNRYTVLVYYLNSDLKTKAASPGLTYGMVVPCGEYPTRDQAEKARDEISIKTGANYVAICCNNTPLPLNEKSTGMIYYERGQDQSVDEIQQSLQRSKKRQQAASDNLTKEVSERSNPDTISYFMNQLYLLGNAQSRISYLSSNLEEAQSRLSENKQSVLDYIKRNPNDLDKWKDEAYNRLTERNEPHTYAMITNTFDKVMKELTP